MRLLLTAALALCAVPATSVGQVVHLPPPQHPAEAGKALLTVSSGPTGTTPPSIRVADGRLYLLIPNGSRRVLQLGNRTIAEFLISLDDQDRAGFLFKSESPEVSATEIEERTFDPVGGVVTLTQRNEPPNVQVAAAIGFVANESRPRTGGNSLMRNAGIDLDLVARKAIGLGILRARLGFRTAEPVATGENTGPPTTSMDPRSIVEGAQAIVLGGHLDLAVMPPNKSNDLHLSVGIEGTQYWAAPESFQMPSYLIVDGEDRPIADYFTAAHADVNGTGYYVLFIIYGLLFLSSSMLLPLIKENA